jgi:integrase
LGYYQEKASEGKIRFQDYAFLYTLFWSGMRPSEATALRWGDIDLAAGRAEITKSRHLGAESAPKTRGSQRTISLLPTIVEILRFLKPLNITETDYVFCDTSGRPIDAAEWRKRHWNKALRAKDIRPRKFYATRHTYISVALSHGVNIKWLAEQCGTSVEMIERNYGKFIRSDGDAPLRALVEAKTETLTETLMDAVGEDIAQLTEKIGATRRIRTADLLITKNNPLLPNLTQPEKKQQKQSK